MYSVFKVYDIYFPACRNETIVLMNTQTNLLIDAIFSVDCRILRIVESDLKKID